MTLKLIGSWIFGGILITVSAWILGHIDQTVGVSPVSYGLAFFVAFVLILVGGLAWISVATATAKH
ncbi:MAG: hypothetical protein JSV39_03745 [Candidatus Aenigmatarchaeota archaeon]|nr:MAG: hypothetical protein JSV39_03745 [Candidatus Aenigmarchaeota archaeon]